MYPSRIKRMYLESWILHFAGLGSTELDRLLLLLVTTRHVGVRSSDGLFSELHGPPETIDMDVLNKCIQY